MLKIFWCEGKITTSGAAISEWLRSANGKVPGALTNCSQFQVLQYVQMHSDKKIYTQKEKRSGEEASMINWSTHLSSLSERLSARSKEGALYTSESSNFFMKPFRSSGDVHLKRKHTLYSGLDLQTLQYPKLSVSI